MAKLSRKKRKSSRKSPGGSGALAHLNRVLNQTKALLHANQVHEALGLLEANVNRLGQFAAFQAALATVYGEVGRYQDAARHARVAIDLDPKQADYYLLTAMTYMSAGYFTLAARARRVWLRTAPRGPLLPEMRQLDEDYRRGSELLQTEYGVRDTKTAEEAGYQLDEGRWALTQDRWKDALQHARAASKLIPGWPPPRNNATMALYYLGRYAEAVAEAEAVLRDGDPDNVHALSNLVRCHTILGDPARANEYGNRLARLPLSSDPANVVKQIEGLAFLDRDAEIERILVEAEAEFDELPADLYVHWGIVAANAGRRKEALAHLQRAQQAGVASQILQDTLEALQSGQTGLGTADRFSHTHYVDLIDRDAIEKAINQALLDKKTKKHDDRAWAELVRQFPQLPLVVRKMLYEAPEGVIPMAQLLACLRTPAAVAALHEFVSGQLGEQEDRMAALRIMQQTGVLPRGAQIEMWIEGKHQPVRTMLQEISDEFVPDYSPEVWDLYAQALTAGREGRVAEAERLYEAMLRIEPNAKEAYNNLATIYLKRGDTARADEYVDKALEIDPLYPFPRTARALQALQQEGVEAAKAWMEPLHAIQQWHPLGFAVYQKAMARIATKEQLYDVAIRHLEAAKQINEDDPDIAPLLSRVTLLETFSKGSAIWQERVDSYRRRRQQAPLPADPTLADCFGLLTKGDMTGIRQVHGLSGVSAYKKAQLRDYLMSLLSDADHLVDRVAGLTDTERAALDDILGHDGIMGRQEFIDAHGDDRDDSPYLEYHATQSKTTAGRLCAHGLLFQGAINERTVFVVPRELRPLLREILA
ncbi:MAG: hypothetical protein CVU38_00775 [Chloroflexi bacterium HGW-Chloroflexi-1]|nr:MAG: hypothetical protein CVU38_00775 [Chloroflexi bacterium HGW-Chloroflexi-1]